ncbi:hypothetical protein [Candidatus Phytoplasma tritici]|nr:hypothetical protein [Candidatus Phytoplasma tritici]
MNSEILIFDLEEAFIEYFGNKQEYLTNNNLIQKAKESYEKKRHMKR